MIRKPHMKRMRGQVLRKMGSTRCAAVSVTILDQYIPGATRGIGEAFMVEID